MVNGILWKKGNIVRCSGNADLNKHRDFFTTVLHRALNVLIMCISPRGILWEEFPKFI